MYRSVLRGEIFERLQAAFAERPSQESFWSAHSYDDPDTCYFSYWDALTEAPSNLVEEAIRSLHSSLLPHHPGLKRCRGAEWWVHKRGHGDAHQLHYDTDENFFQTGRGVKHPILSSVLFLSACGGPLLVADQRLGQLVDQGRGGWLVSPAQNQLAVFEGQLLASGRAE